MEHHEVDWGENFLMIWKPWISKRLRQLGPQKGSTKIGRWRKPRGKNVHLFPSGWVKLKCWEVLERWVKHFEQKSVLLAPSDQGVRSLKKPKKPCWRETPWNLLKQTWQPLPGRSRYVTCRGLHCVAASYPQKGSMGQANVDPWMVWVLSKKEILLYLLFYMGKSRKIKPMSLIQLDVHCVETKHGWFNGSWVGGRLHKVVLFLKMPEN